VLRLVVYARAERYESRRLEMERTIASIRPAGAGSAHPPARLQVIDAGPLRLDEAAAAFPGPVSVRTLALLNGMDPGGPDAVVPQPMKRVVAPDMQ
jgi:hypothetical protein